MTPIGIIGCGQLARMLALEGWQMGLRFSFAAEGEESTVCVDGLGRVVRVADCASHEELHRAMGSPELVTVEREQIDPELLRGLARHCRVLPDPELVRACGNRLRERALLSSLEIPVSEYREARSAAEVRAAAEELGLPLVVKAADGGYDGRAQYRLNRAAELDAFCAEPRDGEWLVERRVPFEREISFLGARSANGEIALYPATENRHRRGVLLTSLAPAPGLPDAVEARGRDYLLRLLQQDGYVGMLAMECFLVDGGLLVNELAPRVHNSGHWTLHSELTSQFQNHLRALLGMTPGATALHRCEGMLNILGPYDRDRLLHELSAEAVLVDYNKKPAPGRKLGHIGIAHRDPAVVANEIERLHRCLYDEDLPDRAAPRSG